MRAYNFSAGPAMLPTAVLTRAQNDLLDWRETGMSVMEISHRSEAFLTHVFEPANANLKKLLGISARTDYSVLWMSMGTSHQFSMLPLNLLGRKKHNTALYFNTGIWSGKAIKEAKRYGDIKIKDNNFESFESNDNYDADLLSYIHYTPNETIEGFQFPSIPNTGDIPLIADMSSEILSKPIEIEKFGFIYAGAQKNIGPSGLTIGIIRHDLLAYAKPETPILYQYKTYAENQSLYNTPNTFAIYLAGLVFEWLIEQGGLPAIQEINQRKAQKLYEFIHQSAFYRCPVAQAYCSEMNIVFYSPSAELDTLFIAEAAKENLLYLKGHKAVGGMRASLYNAMPEEGVTALVSFMREFERRYG